MNSGKHRIIVTELPYNVNKAKLVEKIADLVRDKRIDGITDLRDESDKSGMRVVIELRRDVDPRVILNQLYKHTQMQDTFGVIMLALVDGEPKVLNLKQVLHYYVEHQKDVVIRRCRHELKKAENDAHIREGLLIALDHIDEIISIIRGSQNDQVAKQTLMERFELTERQAVAILDMQLRRLTGLERENRSRARAAARIQETENNLGDMNLVYNIIKELMEIKETFSDSSKNDDREMILIWILKI